MKFEIDRGFLSVGNKHETYVELVEPAIVLVDAPVVRTEEVRKYSAPTLIVAHYFEEEPTNYLGMMQKIGGHVYGVVAPGFGESRSEILKDLYAFTHGRAKRVIITDMETLIFDGYGSVSDRVKEINELIAVTESDYDCEKLRARLRQLTG